MRRTKLEIWQDKLSDAQLILGNVSSQVEKVLGEDSPVAMKIGCMCCTIDECVSELEEEMEKRRKE